MFGLLNNEQASKIEQLAEKLLNELGAEKLDHTLVEELCSTDGFLKEVVFEDLNGSLDEQVVEEDGLILKIPKSVPLDVRNLLIARGIARILLNSYQDELGKKRSEDYLYGSDWTHTQNDEIKFLALCLIMPQSVFKDIMENKAVNKENGRVSIDALKRYFNIPEQSIIQRGMSLNMFTSSRQISSK